MAANTPPLPHNEGDTFTNEETGIKYQFINGAWRAVSSKAAEDVADAVGSINLQKVLDNGNTADKGAEFGDNLHIIKHPVNGATIDNVPFVISRSADEAGSVARFRVGEVDVLKINNDGQLECENRRIIQVGEPELSDDAATANYVNEAKDSAYQYTDDKTSQALQDAKDYSDSTTPNTSGFLMLNGSRAMTGLLNMGNNTIGALANPVGSGDAANKRWVEDQIASGVENPQMQLQLWQFKGMASSDDEFRNLRAGEFMIRHKSTSGTYDWELAINVKDKDGKNWYPNNKSSNYAHTNHIDYVTINDCFGTVRWGGKQESLHFNEWSGIGSYLRVDGRYWKQTYTGDPFTKDWWYIIKLSGLLPHWKYPLSVQQNGQTSFNTDFYGVDEDNEQLADTNGSGEQ